MKKYWLAFASVIMIAVGLIRGKIGIDLLIDGDTLSAIESVKGSPESLKAAGICLIIVCCLLVSSGIILTVRRYVANYVYCWISLLIFLVYGFINSFLLFDRLFIPGQLIDLGISLVTAVFLILGKDSIKSKYIQEYEYK